MKLVKVVALLLFLGACTNSAPFAPPEEDATGKRYDPPAPGKVAVYVVRPSNFNFAYAINISVGQRMAGTLGGRSWLRVDVDPGRHDMAAGESRFFLVRPNMGIASARCRVEEVDSAAGRGYIESSRRVIEAQ